MGVGVDDDLGSAVGRLERGEAVVEDRDLEGGEGDLRSSARPPGRVGHSGQCAREGRNVRSWRWIA